MNSLSFSDDLKKNHMNSKQKLLVENLQSLKFSDFEQKVTNDDGDHNFDSFTSL